MLNVMVMYCNSLHVFKMMLVMFIAINLALQVMVINARLSKSSVTQALHCITLHHYAYLCIFIFKIVTNLMTGIVFDQRLF